MAAMAAYSRVDLEQGQPVPQSVFKDPELVQCGGGPFTFKKSIGQVTVRCPAYDKPLLLVAMLYGFFPWLVPVSFFIWWFMTHDFIPLYAVLISLSCAAVNEGILKPLVKDPRPELTANRYGPERDFELKPGMPSGHVLNATALMVWLLLEICLKGDAPPPIPKYWMLACAIVMVPVPWARWYNSDHTARQCMVSSALGLVVGATAFYVRITYYRHHYAPWKG